MRRDISVLIVEIFLILIVLFSIFGTSYVLRDDAISITIYCGILADAMPVTAAAYWYM